jgi:hypothetical protein
LSKTISQEWKALTPKERDHWDELANEKKREHETLYPNYVYRPQCSSKKKRAPASASTTPATRQRKPSALFVVPAPSPDQAIQMVRPTSDSGLSSRVDGHGDSLTSLKPADMQLGVDHVAPAIVVANRADGFDNMPSSAGLLDLETSLNLQVRFLLPLCLSFLGS